MMKDFPTCALQRDALNLLHVYYVHAGVYSKLLRPQADTAFHFFSPFQGT